ncbi:MAG: hypothetical protein M1837_000321 [Sclerophora amabilis]|nr:MAG: hypothetical protein M1837_000321 [Sclerophora amabilis]
MSGSLMATMPVVLIGFNLISHSHAEEEALERRKYGSAAFMAALSSRMISASHALTASGYHKAECWKTDGTTFDRLTVKDEALTESCCNPSAGGGDHRQSKNFKFYPIKKECALVASPDYDDSMNLDIPNFVACCNALKPAPRQTEGPCCWGSSSAETSMEIVGDPRKVYEIVKKNVGDSSHVATSDQLEDAALVPEGAGLEPFSCPKVPADLATAKSLIIYELAECPPVQAEAKTETDKHYGAWFKGKDGGDKIKLLYTSASRHPVVGLEKVDDYVIKKS